MTATALEVSINQILLLLLDLLLGGGRSVLGSMMVAPVTFQTVRLAFFSAGGFAVMSLLLVVHVNIKPWRSTRLNMGHKPFMMLSLGSRTFKCESLVPYRVRG